MKKNFGVIFGAMLFFMFVGGNLSFAESNKSFTEVEILDLENEINTIMNEELGSLIQSDNDDVTVGIGGISIELDEGTLELYDYDKDKIIDAFRQEAKELKQGFENTEVDIIKEESQQLNGEISPLSVIDKGSYYVARVWAGVPSGGWGYINQDFTASNLNNKIHNIKLIGPSYKSGVLVGSWSHNRSWFEVQRYAVQADIRMKGVIEYIFKGSPISLPATFLKTVSVFDLR